MTSNHLRAFEKQHALIAVSLQELLRAVDASDWESLANRRVQHYGFRFEYKVGDSWPAIALRILCHVNPEGA